MCLLRAADNPLDQHLLVVALRHNNHHVLEQVQQLIQLAQVVLLDLASLEIYTALGLILEPLLHGGQDLGQGHLNRENVGVDAVHDLWQYGVQFMDRDQLCLVKVWECA